MREEKTIINEINTIFFGEIICKFSSINKMDIAPMHNKIGVIVKLTLLKLYISNKHANAKIVTIDNAMLPATLNTV